MNILGMGVNAIDVDLSINNNDNSIKNIVLSKIVIGNYQPRKSGRITNNSLNDLIESIKMIGVLQPIIVREISAEVYELIAGERRYRAALDIGLNVIPCIIKYVNEKDAMAIAIIENIQREQLTLIDESDSLLRLKEEFFLSVEQVSKLVSKPRSSVANLIRVATHLSMEGKLLWENGEVEYGHIRAVVVLEHKHQNIVLQYVVDKKLSVRETERFIKSAKYLNVYDKNDEELDRNLVISNQEIELLANKFTNKYKNKILISPLKTGKIRVSIEFDNIKNTYDFISKC